MSLAEPDLNMDQSDFEAAYQERRGLDADQFVALGLQSSACVCDAPGCRGWIVTDQDQRDSGSFPVHSADGL